MTDTKPLWIDLKSNKMKHFRTHRLLGNQMMSLERDWKAEKKDLQEAFDIIADKLVKADAEIERLKAENARLKKWNLMTDEQVVMDLKAEIERLQAEQIKMFKAYDAIEQKSVGQKSLFAELAKALEKANPDRYKTLIQRAREAIKLSNPFKTFREADSGREI